MVIVTQTAENRVSASSAPSAVERSCDRDLLMPGVKHIPLARPLADRLELRGSYSERVRSTSAGAQSPQRQSCAFLAIGRTAADLRLLWPVCITLVTVSPHEPWLTQGRWDGVGRGDILGWVNLLREQIQDLARFLVPGLVMVRVVLLVVLRV